MNTKKYKSVFISDTHMLSEFTNFENLQLLFDNVDCESLYLVGDIFDLIAFSRIKRNKLKKKEIFLLESFIKMINRCGDVYYVYGNHDKHLFKKIKDHIFFDKITVLRETYYTDLHHRVYYVTHGDKFDCLIPFNKYIKKLGELAYDSLMILNGVFNDLLITLKLRKMFLIHQMKKYCRNLSHYTSKFEDLAIEEARRKKVSGIICGHIHNGKIVSANDVMYMNCGDWVGCNSFIVENYSGDFQLLYVDDLKYN